VDEVMLDLSDRATRISVLFLGSINISSRARSFLPCGPWIESLIGHNPGGDDGMNSSSVFDRQFRLISIWRLMMPSKSGAIDSLATRSANMPLMATAAIGAVSVPAGEYCSIVRVRAWRAVRTTMSCSRARMSFGMQYFSRPGARA